MSVYKKVVSIADRPMCCVGGCTNRGQHTGSYRKDGTPVFRKMCGKHHEEFCANKHGLTPTQWKNSFHPYLKHRKTYCENVDGRLGFDCTSNIVWEGMLQVDHIDGNPENNDESNLQTLCACCHVYKSWLNKDYATPGRKTLKRAV
jgi:hypothetical protein